MTMRHIAADGATYSGNCFNIQPTSRQVMYYFKALAKTAGWRVLQSGDGVGAYSSSGDILTNTNTGTGNTTGAPNFFILAAATGPDTVANSICNYNAWFVIAPPSGAAASFQGELCIQISFLFDNGSRYVGLRVRYSKTGFDSSTSSATTAPAPNGTGNAVVLFGAGTEVSPDTGSYWLNALNTNMRMNMGVDDDTTRPVFWLEAHDSATDESRVFSFWDALTSLRANDTDAVVVGWLGGAGSTGVSNALSQIGTEGWTPTTMSGWCATTLGDNITRYVSAAWLANSTGDFALALGVDTTNSNREADLYVEWVRTTRVGWPNGYKGRSLAFIWRTAATSRRQVDLKNQNGSGVSHVLNGTVWSPLNYGSTASGGTNGVAITY